MSRQQMGGISENSEQRSLFCERRFLVKMLFCIAHLSFLPAQSPNQPKRTQPRTIRYFQSVRKKQRTDDKPRAIKLAWIAEVRRRKSPRSRINRCQSVTEMEKSIPPIPIPCKRIVGFSINMLRKIRAGFLSVSFGGACRLFVSKTNVL